MSIPTADLSGVNPGYYPSLEELLWEWIATIQKTFRVMGTGDAPWWYNERTSLALLAGAIWRAGGVALQEHDIERKKPEKSSGSKHGRCDLYFAVDRRHFIAEAKQLWLPLRAQDPRGKIKEKLTEAIKAVRSSGDEGYERLAILFISPHAPESVLGARECSSNEIDRLISDFVDKSLDTYTKTARAWAFPQATRKLSDQDRKNPRIYPGAAVLIQGVKE